MEGTVVLLHREIIRTFDEAVPISTSEGGYSDNNNVASSDDNTALSRANDGEIDSIPPSNNGGALALATNTEGATSQNSRSSAKITSTLDLFGNNIVEHTNTNIGHQRTHS
jgi:hypothetical protein